MENNPLIPIILCGGSGSRLWPLSRLSLPKQYLSLSLNSQDKNTLLQKTILRTKNIKNISNPILICNEENRFIAAEQLRNVNNCKNSILLEPFGRNTAPAITIGALKALEKEDNPNILIMPSDHEIKDIDKFRLIIEEGIKYANQGRLVTFGVIPKSPETGYGYIQSEDPLDPNNIKGANIVKFIEKPNQVVAEKLIKDRRYLWNSGIFLFNAKSIIEEIKKFCPDIFVSCSKSFTKKIIDLDFERIDKKLFHDCPNISIDVGVMEKTNLGTILPLDVGWSDMGSWDSVWSNSLKDKKNNFIKGNFISKDNENCYLRSESKLIAGIGLKNLIVVETNDAILIVDKEHSQKVKNLVEELKVNNIPEGKTHTRIYRPWGDYQEIAEDSRWKVKLITVQPGSQLSLQMHHHRAEHWIVVKGTAKVEIDNQELFLCENQSTFIPLGSKHRLTNPGKIPLKLIEVQSGSYLGEDDIKRFHDNYGRT